MCFLNCFSFEKDQSLWDSITLSDLINNPFYCTFWFHNAGFSWWEIFCSFCLFATWKTWALLHSAAWTPRSICSIIGCSRCKDFSCTVYFSAVVFCLTDIFLTKAVWSLELLDRTEAFVYLPGLFVVFIFFLMFVLWLRQCFILNELYKFFLSTVKVFGNLFS